MKNQNLLSQTLILGLFALLTINIGHAQGMLLSPKDKADLKILHDLRRQDFKTFSPEVQAYIRNKMRVDHENRPSIEEIRERVLAFSQLSDDQKQDLYLKAEKKRQKILHAESDEEVIELIEEKDDFEKLLPPPPPRFPIRFIAEILSQSP